MTTEYPRTFAVDGPLSLSVRLVAGECLITAADDVDQAVVDLQPMTDDDEAALAAIEETRVELRGDALRLPPRPGRAGTGTGADRYHRGRRGGVGRDSHRRDGRCGGCPDRLRRPDGRALW